MDNLRKYILSTFNMDVDCNAKQYSKNSKLQLLKKEKYYIYPEEIQYAHLKTKQAEYEKHILKATQVWSNILDNIITFELTDKLWGADIKVFWAKSGRRVAGKQFIEEFGNHKIPCTTIGIMDMNGRDYESKDVYQTILHEFGHIMGLGHSDNKKDVMYFGWEGATKPSENDILVLKLIYTLGQKSYSECQDYIEEYISQNKKQNFDIVNSDRNISDEIQNIGNIKKYQLHLQNINVKYPKNRRG